MLSFEANQDAVNFMSNEANERVRAIQSRVSEERAQLSKLESVISDPRLKTLAKPASHLLDDVEGFFLDTKILREERPPAALAGWLDEAEKVLRLATQQREFFNAIIEKFGPNARIISA